MSIKEAEARKGISASFLFLEHNMWYGQLAEGQYDSLGLVARPYFL